MAKVVGSKIDSKAIDKKVAKSRRFQKDADNHARKRLEKAKCKLMEEFNQHSVTKEIEAGASAENVSKTLRGYGNLFSFIGFEANSKPVDAVRNFLNSFITLKSAGKPSKTGSTREYVVKTPDLADFKVARMPWEGGRNWVQAIEEGISGFSYFMNKAHEAARSGAGIQIDNKLRSKDSASMSYMSDILRKFKRRLKSK
ncbi:MAG: hypothetical protein CMI54_07545 [Parcubacteria group bacterium]|nr:hypothetical protein [Parcubacteria group bacterium]|tara:strand:- start:10032 stop:10628 length:597 start_codon:yes stop_codon:yes gene_type:complete